MQTHNRRRAPWLRPMAGMAGVWLAVTACSFDYTGAAVEQEDPDSVPQLEIFDARMVIERDNRLELEAEWIASYPRLNTQEFGRLAFREYGPDGDLRVEGQADSGVLYTDVENVELRGTVRFFSQVEEAELESEFMFWDNAERVLVGDPDDEIRIRQDDGTELRGRGFRIDGRRNTLEFSGAVTGRYAAAEEEDDSGRTGDDASR